MKLVLDVIEQLGAYQPDRLSAARTSILLTLTIE
ncbi:MAG: hypothetical protein ACJAYW_001326 [Candidatus Azotimanducaceae bacterium]|jgi:hypothetical protein